MKKNRELLRNAVLEPVYGFYGHGVVKSTTEAKQASLAEYNYRDPEAFGRTARMTL